MTRPSTQNFRAAANTGRRLSVAQYKKRKTAWKIGPNIPGRKMAQMLLNLDRRRTQGKDTIYRFHSQVVAREKLERGRRRFREELSKAEPSPSPPNSVLNTAALSDVEWFFFSHGREEASYTTVDRQSRPLVPQSDPTDNAPNCSEQPPNNFNVGLVGLPDPFPNTASMASNATVSPFGATTDECGVRTVLWGTTDLQNPRRNIFDEICSMDAQGRRQNPGHSGRVSFANVGYNSVSARVLAGNNPSSTQCGKEGEDLLPANIHRVSFYDRDMWDLRKDFPAVFVAPEPRLASQR
ncbi:hypothetical protein K440DRAFT_643934 [Wilcoxina mikolae CBS 423.85]|nr:hypothetical protein K440DRAFT_643934 [Wilcoxina mikolae CBS 423.85]